jgi:hypothetical protein
MSTSIPKGSKRGGLVKSHVPKDIKKNFFSLGVSSNSVVCHFMCWISDSSDIAPAFPDACGHIKVSSLWIMFGHNSIPAMDGS